MISNLKMLVLATFLFFAISCEEDDSAPGDEEKAILTKSEWVLSAIVGHHYDNWDPIDFTADDLIVEQNTLNGIFQNSTWNFHANGTYTFYISGLNETQEGTWNYSSEFESMSLNMGTSNEYFFDIEISNTQVIMHDRIEGATNVSEYVATYLPN